MLCCAAACVVTQGAAPEWFGPGANAAFTPDGRTLYVTHKTGADGNTGVIMESRRSRDGWGARTVASFSGHYADFDPFVAPGGSRLFFISNRPLTGDGEARPDFDIWFV